MKLFITILGAFFSILGAIALLSGIAGRFLKPKFIENFDRDRISFLVLSLSIAVALIWGVYSKSQTKKKNIIIRLLNQLETRLLQIESLVNQTIVSGEKNVDKALLHKMAEQVSAYGHRTGENVKEIRGELVLVGFNLEPMNKKVSAKLHQLMAGVTNQLQYWENIGDRKFTNEELLKLLGAIEEAKAEIRILLDEYR